MKPVVISRPDRVGDVIVTSSCIPLVRELHPGAPIYLIAQSLMHSLFAGAGNVDGCIPYAGADDDELLREKLQSLDAAVIYHFHPHAGIQAIAAAVGIPQRIGFELNGDATELTDALPYHKSEGLMHEAEYCRELLVKSSGRELALIGEAAIAPDPAARDRLRLKAPWLDEDETRVVINPTAARLVLRWPPEYFEQLIAGLAGCGRRIILAGHPKDDPALTYLRQRCHAVQGNWSDLSGRLDLAESAWLFQACDLHISRDTGTSHLAAAMGCKTLVIFARLEPEYGPVRWKPLGDGTQLVTSEASKHWWETRRQFWKRSFRSIKAERVIETAQQMLK